MPEGDTVFRTARRLDEAVAGAEVTRFDLRVPRFATLDLTGQPVHGVVPRGKHLLMRIGDSTLHSHLRMDGAWFVYRPGERWRHPAFRYVRSSAPPSVMPSGSTSPRSRSCHS